MHEFIYGIPFYHHCQTNTKSALDSSETRWLTPGINLEDGMELQRHELLLG